MAAMDSSNSPGSSVDQAATPQAEQQNGASMSPAPDVKPSQTSSILKERRFKLSRACDRCRRRRIKCDEGHPCQSCLTSSSACTFEEPGKRTHPHKSKYASAVSSLRTLPRLCVFLLCASVSSSLGLASPGPLHPKRGLTYPGHDCQVTATTLSRSRLLSPVVPLGQPSPYIHTFEGSSAPFYVRHL
ncbi:hypothetical protein BD311DRAFT_73648 [Dichomitus squalens]|uniref:Zn(2)-C6 fungal-type domain-containing protein n=1 Tax=Dichomitus squalens TaxID=114155 RepID=A0A4Q9MCD9_9APHY|nr:hypothetical protein BD311DRAFT_73648 [Dichomitus squalens]